MIIFDNESGPPDCAWCFANESDPVLSVGSLHVDRILLRYVLQTRLDSQPNFRYFTQRTHHSDELDKFSLSLPVDLIDL